MRKHKNVITILLLFIVIISNVNAQTNKSSQAPKAKSKAELDAYSELYSEKDMSKKAGLSNSFLRAFPNSEFRIFAAQLGIQANIALGKHNEIVRIGEKILTELPQTKLKSKIRILTLMMNSYQQLNNFNKTVSVSNHLLRLDPEYLPALLKLSSILPHILPEEIEARDSQLQRALNITLRTKEQVNIYLSRPKPTKFTISQWEKRRLNLFSQIHTALAAIYFHRKDFTLAIQEYEKATELVRTDGVSFYKMGTAYIYQAKTVREEIAQIVHNKTSDLSIRDEKVGQYEIMRDKAIESLAKVIALKKYVPTKILQAAKADIERLYLSKNNNSLVGLEALILELGQDLTSN